MTANGGLEANRETYVYIDGAHELNNVVVVYVASESREYGMGEIDGFGWKKDLKIY